jgi:bleomycin hydrolase
MFKHLFLFILSTLLVTQLVHAQEATPADTVEGYVFTIVEEVKTTPVKNQYKSGTCWSFAATSFIETEILRIKGEKLDLSEMYFVRNAYINKAVRYVRYHGRSNFSAGGQAHDVTNTINAHGILPESVYNGLEIGEDKHNHGEMDAVLKGFMDGVVKRKGGKITPRWLEAFQAILDVYLGKVPDEFEYDGTWFTPASFAEFTEFNPEDYVEITSYNHHPFYEKIDLEIPDNWSADDYYNVSLEDLMGVIDHALENGYSVCWDGDVSDRGFSYKNGVAIIPDVNIEDLSSTERSRWESLSDSEKRDRMYNFEEPGDEKEITQDLRQIHFDNLTATDDHLMHLTGIVSDQDGTNYYRTKNSWGTERNEFEGYLNMSSSYVKLNTVAVMVHKDAIPKKLAEKLGLD